LRRTRHTYKYDRWQNEDLFHTKYILGLKNAFTAIKVASLERERDDFEQPVT
jgi:hypothetical protein